MSKQKLIANLISQVFVVCFCAVLVFGQPPSKDPDSDVAKKPKKVKAEPEDVFKRWLNEDVAVLITPAEREAFLKLKTNEERENFIKIFWDKRDPNPDTEENEFRDAYYERIAYVNEHFSSGIPGWKTDRGRIYVTWGKPDSVESQPSGGSYEKAVHEGGGSATTYPFEKWFYRHLDGVGDGIEIEFVDQTGSGEYRLVRDINEKFLTIGPPQPVNTSNASYLREQDLPFNVIERNSRLFSPPSVKGGSSEIGGITDSTLLDKNPIDLDMQIGFFRQSENRVITTFTIQTENKDLQFESSGGLGTARLNIFGRLSSVAGRSVETFEDSVTTNATPAELINIKNQKSIYQHVAALPSGVYKVDLVVRDIATGNRGLVSKGFTVPRYEEKSLSTSTLVLASTLRAVDARDIGNRFVVGNTKLIPNLSGVYKQGQQVGVYMQVYNAGIDQTTLRPSVDVDYIILKDGKVVSNIPEDWNGLSDSSQRLTLARLLPTEKLEPGDYEIKVVIKDRTAEKQKVIDNKAALTITK